MRSAAVISTRCWLRPNKPGTPIGKIGRQGFGGSNACFTAVTWIGFAAIVLAPINVVGGFLVTNRMLSMFKRKD